MATGNLCAIFMLPLVSAEGAFGSAAACRRFGCGSLLPQGMFRSWRCTVADVMEFRYAPPCGEKSPNGA